MDIKKISLIFILVLVIAFSYFYSLPKNLYLSIMMWHDRPIIGESANGGFSDPAICNRLWGSDVRDHCLRQVSTSLKNPTLCAMIQSLSDRDLCYLDVSILQKDYKGCDRIASSEIRIYCSALVRKDVKLCDQVRQFDYKNTCYLTVAKAKLDLAICEKIVDQGEPKTDNKAKCNKVVGELVSNN
jgi:hypothetical protein